MYFYAHLDANNVVIGVSCWTNAQPVAANIQAIDSLRQEYIGARKWDSVSNSFVPYDPPARVLSKYAFNSRFTFNELVAIKDAAKTDSQVAVLQDKFSIAESIDLDDPMVSQGLDLLITKNLILTARKAEITA